MIQTKEIIGEITASGESGYDTCNRLMRKFELDKKIYAGYDEELREPAASTEISDEEYRQLAICLCLQAVKYDDVRFYNTALKIGDAIAMELPEINFTTE